MWDRLKSDAQGIAAMRCRALLCSVLLVTGALFAQAPVPVGKVQTSAKNYRGADGTTLSKNSSDSELENAINAGLSDNPEFREVRASVHKHHVTLMGNVSDKDVKHRAESKADHFVGVRSVKNKIKVGEMETQRATISTSAQ